VIQTGGQVERQGGVWCLPTVITQVNHTMTVMQEETFGPILPVMSFKTEEEAIALANDTDFGLSASVFSQDQEHAETVAREIDAGGISLNDASLTAFVQEAEKNSFKLSGLGGSRMGAAGYLRFFRKKALIYNTGAVADIQQFDEALFRPKEA
jgi:succinate-semialdehyde dehydrogenase/glutarate-semialdehyde dehydrogenase